MKKLLCLLLVCLLTVSMLSCASTPTKEENNENNVSTMPSNETQGDIPLLTFSTLEEYKAFMQENEVPDHFVAYEDITALGEFDSLVFTEGYPLRYQTYFYSFTNEVTLTVNHEEELRYPWTVNSAPPTGLDLRTHEAGNGHCQIYDMTYSYVLGGKLHAVRWRSGEVWFTVGGFLEYEGGSETVDLLLNKETAPNFKAMCDEYVAQKIALK